MAQFNLLDTIMQQSRRSGQAAENLALARIRAADEGERLTAEISKDATTVGQNLGLVEQTRMIGQMQVQQANRRALEAAGGEAELLAQISEANTQAARIQKRMKDLNELNSRSIFTDGPLAVIGALIQRGDVRDDLRAAAGELQVAQNRIDVIDKTVDAATRRNNAAAQTITAGAIQASTSAIEAEWQMKANKAQLEGLQYGTLRANAIADAEDSALDRHIKVQSVINAEENQELQRRNAARLERMQQLQEQELLMQRATREEQVMNEEKNRNAVNIYRNSLGQPPLSPADWSRYKSVTPQEQLFQQVMHGEATLATGKPIIGNSPSEVAQVLARNPNLQLPEMRQATVKLVQEAMVALGQAKTKPKTASDMELANDKDGSKAKAYIDSYVQGKLSQQLSLIDDSSSNLFNVGALSSYIGTEETPGIRILQRYPVTQKVLLPAIKAGDNLADPNKVMRLTVEGIESGLITSSQAVQGLVAVYKRANLINREFRGFDGIGFRTPADGMGYRVKIGDDPVDLTNEVEVLTALNRQLQKKALLKARMSGAAPFAAGAIGGVLDSYGQSMTSGRTGIPEPGAITYTPANQAEGVRRARESMRGNP